jgi:hypothetical protein
MAVPTITAVAPNLGATGGGNLVEVTGTNFKLWQIPPPSGGRTGATVPPTVQVLFGGSPSTDVAVVSATRLFCVAPRTVLPATSEAGYGEGSVDVVVRNLASNGTPIAGEEATLAAGYKYRRVQLARESELNRLNRALLREWNVQVLSNVSMTTHTDFDPETGDAKNITALATIPGIALLGPELTTNRFYSVNQRPVTALAGIERAIRRVPETVDVTYTIVGAARLHVEATNLMAIVRGFFEQNKSVSIYRDKDDPSKGSVEFPIELDRVNDLKMDLTPSDANVHWFSGRFSVKGFTFEDLAGFPGHQIAARTAQVTEDPGILLVPMEEES